MTNEAPSPLALATEELYRTFAAYKLAPRVEGCSHCVSEADESRLHSVPLRELQHEHLARFAFKTMTTWGSADDFRHFLPRIFELISLDGGQWLDPEVAFGKLTYGNWTSWPPQEQNAMRSFIRSMWLDVLGRCPHPFAANDCLCSIAQAEDDLAWYLATWDVPNSESAARHLADFLEENVPQRPNSWNCSWKLGNAFWKQRPEQLRQVTNWILSPQRAKDLEQAFFAYGLRDGETAQHLSDALNHLSSIVSAAIQCPSSGGDVTPT